MEEKMMQLMIRMLQKICTEKNLSFPSFANLLNDDKFVAIVHDTVLDSKAEDETRHRFMELQDYVYDAIYDELLERKAIT
jgi:hypothetical protein